MAHGRPDDIARALPRDVAHDHTRTHGGSPPAAPCSRPQACASSTSARSPSTPRCCGATSRASAASPRCRSGFAGPLLVDGEHAHGEFFVPLATTRGHAGRELQPRDAAHPRGRRHQDHRHRRRHAARSAVRLPRRPGRPRLRRAGSTSTSPPSRPRPRRASRFAKLVRIEQYAVGKMRFLRFDYTTGDAGGQNMVTKATHDACTWMIDQGLDGLEHFTLSANLDTDKKHSTLNNLHTRGKRVVAEVTVPGPPHRARSCTPPAATLYRPAPAVERGEPARRSRRTTAPTTRTASPRCSSPAARTWPTWPRRPRASATPSSTTTATTTSRSRSRRSSWPRAAEGRACRRSGSASRCSAATGPARCASWPRSSRPRCCAASCRSAPPSSSDQWVSSHESLGRNPPPPSS